MMRTTKALYDAKARAWYLHCEHERDAIRAAFPDTGGNALYLHNWYVCSRDADKSARAVALRNALSARWARARAWYEREYDRAQHADHIARAEVGRYFWCERCQNAIGMHVERIGGLMSNQYRVVPLAR